MIRVVGRRGYQATSVADVIAEAHASRSTFYKYFADKRDGFLGAYELVLERIFAAAEGAGGAEPWPEGPRDALAAIVDLFARDPALARTAVVEFAAAGEQARRRHRAALDRLARLLEKERPPSRPCLPPSTALMAVSGVAGLIADEIRAGRAHDLPRFLPELEFAMLVPFLGPRAAAGWEPRDDAQLRSPASNL
ncbi:MAG TPA: helix-turn-helix domain-containing protein [Solirubrobacterales bacterium]|nr:helix-turn-helix domain-containing protein [Solirubrobacterales bacterium]